MTSTFVSIDWDFFVREDPAWDWGHGESPLFMGQLMWAIRAGQLLATDIDPYAELDPQRHANPTPEKFFAVLKRLGFNFADADALWVAESHAAAMIMLLELFDPKIGVDEPPDVIFNFDAHHDLGYKGFEQTVCRLKEGQVHCDDWLALSMIRHPGTEVRIVLPDWESADVSAVKESARANLSPLLWTRVAIGAFSEAGQPSLELLDGDDFNVVGVFISRSGAWTPPWLDDEFVDFVERASAATFLPPFVFEEPGWPNPLEPRPFDMRDAEQYAQQVRAAMQMAPRK